MVQCGLGQELAATWVESMIILNLDLKVSLMLVPMASPDADVRYQLWHLLCSWDTRSTSILLV